MSKLKQISLENTTVHHSNTDQHFKKLIYHYLSEFTMGQLGKREEGAHRLTEQVKNQPVRKLSHSMSLACPTGRKTVHHGA